MEIGRDWDSVWKNQWPQETDAPGFKTTMLDFFRQCHELHIHVMRSIAIGLDLEEGFFDEKIQEQCHNLRLLSYPPIKRALLDNEGQARAGVHSGRLYFLNHPERLNLSPRRLRHIDTVVPRLGAFLSYLRVPRSNPALGRRA
jgi:hypothetical protein